MGPTPSHSTPTTPTTHARGTRRRNPVPVLVALALVPALVLGGIALWAGSRADAACPGTDPATAPVVTAVESSPALATTLLSYRRAAGEMSRDLNLPPFVEAVQPLLE